METEGSGLKIKLRLGGNIIKPQTTSVAAAAVAPPREKKKRKVPVHERVEKEEDDVHMMEKQAEAPDESPSPTSGERQAVRRSQRRRTGRNKYVLYDNLNDEDYFLEIEKQIETKLDFVSTIMVRLAPARGLSSSISLYRGIENVNSDLNFLCRITNSKTQPKSWMSTRRAKRFVTATCSRRRAFAGPSSSRTPLGLE